MLVSPFQRMNRDQSSGPSRLVNLRNRAAYFSAGLLLATTIAGCPQGADLENPERFVGEVGVGGSVGGTPPIAGMGGSAGATAGAGAGGATAGTAGAGGAAPCPGFSCDVNEALLKSCGRTGCHNATAHYANLILTECSAVAAQMVDVAATHGDIDCAAPGEMFRPCTPAELPATCPQNVMLIDSTNFDNSWVMRKLDPTFVADSCGIGMPAPPGNGTAAGWSDARLACLTEFFRSLATAQ